MSAKTNPKLIGVFVLGAVALAIAGIITFGSGKLFTERERCVLFFDGSVRGLSVGAPVLFRGVRIGSVVDVSLVFDSKDVSFRIPVVIEVEFNRVTEASAQPRKKSDTEVDRPLLNTLIEKGLRAQLNTQSFLTGQLYVMLDLFPDSPVRMSGIQSKYIELPTIPSPIAQIAKRFENIPFEEMIAKTKLILDGIERFVNSSEIEETKVILNTTLKSIQQLTKNLGGQLTPLVANANDVVLNAKKVLAKVDTQVQPLSDDLRAAVASLRDLARHTDQNITPLLLSAQDMIDEDSPLRYRLLKMTDDLGAAAWSLRNLADSLERHPEAVVRGKK